MHSPVRRRRWLGWAAAAALLLPLLSLLPYVVSGTELARARNALVFDASPRPAFEWTAAHVPADFLREEVAPDPYFVEIANRLQLASLPDDWARAVAISRHLLGSAPTLAGGAVQADLRETHRRITVEGDGYCADFVRAFQAIATAAGMPLRLWAFSFDGFGGHGHVFPEIWNRQLGQWQLVDVFNNVYLTTPGSEAPLSALALHDALAASPGSDPALRAVPLLDTARPGFVHTEKLWAYYRRGLPEWYLWWGNNAFTVDGSPLTRTLAPVSRSLAQLGAIADGVQPHAHALALPANADQRAAMQRVKLHLMAAAVVFVLGVMLLLAALLQRGRTSTTKALEAAHGH